MKLLSSIVNGSCEGFCFIKSCEVKVNRNKNEYLDMILADAEGEVNAKLWDYSKERFGTFTPDTVIKVRGTVDTWNGQVQLKIERIRRATDADDVKISDLTPCAPMTSEAMYNEIIKTAEGLDDKDYTALIKTVFEENKSEILRCAAAVRMHHAVSGGLLYHTLAVMRAADALTKVYPFLDRDLVITGAVMHDVEKINELAFGDTGIASGYTVKGNLLGHIAGGVSMLQKYAEQTNLPEEKLLLIQHILLSHHSEPEFGSPVPPMFPEAAVVAALDNLDAHLFEMCAATADIPAGEMTPSRIFGLDRKLYKVRESIKYSIS